MTNVTLTIAIVASMLILYLRPVHALAACLIVLMWYPVYLVVTIGTIDISASRIIVTVLLLKCLANNGLINRFKWCTLDRWVVVYILICVIIPCISSVTHTFMQSVENRSGFVMDSVFFYIVGRLCLVDREAMVDFIKWIGLALIPLALLGIIETTTGWQPFLPLQVFCPWGSEVLSVSRFGFYRAVGPFPLSIQYGSFFVMLLPLIYFLRNVPNYPRRLAYLLCGVAIVGVLTSMSGGPMLMIGVAIVCMVMERYKHLIKPAFVGFITCCILVEVISNRHFYDVFVTSFNPMGGAAYHRSRIIDCAIRTFDEWWMVGYRGLDPGWLPISSITFTDVTNMFLLNGVNYGILGVIGFCGILVCGMRSMVRLHNRSEDHQMRAWAWALNSVLVLVIAFSMGGNFMGQVQFLLYIILAMVGSSSNLRPKVVNIPNKRLESFSSQGIIPP